MYQSAISSSGPRHHSYQQGPRPLPKSAFGRVTTPAPATIQPNPWHILVNNTGSYFFLYDTTASEHGVSEGETYTQGIVVRSQGQGPIKLEISPLAWSGSAEQIPGTLNTGDVTFVYRGGL